MITIDDYLRSMEKTFVPQRARGKHAVLQYVFSGSQTGACYAVIDDGCLRVARGEHPAPTATVYCDFDLFLRIVAYEEDGLLAYEDGKYRIEGDILALMESDTWFDRAPR
ncbi:MAG TPA: SCP2 sterol-binding domain-containing protein [Ktedonobacterales bacterium]|nr:SCP2 sterol-binding domain-containing protein [Ktedonobacterales bacterium]